MSTTNNNMTPEEMLQQMEELGIQTEELRSYDYDDIGIDDAIERIKENQTEIERLTEIANKKIEKIQLNLQLEVMKLEKKIKWDEANIHVAVMDSKDKKETKTQYSKKYVSGNVVIKKGGKQITKPAFKTEEEQNLVKAMFPEFVEDVKEVKLKWADLKKTLELKEDGRVFYEGSDVTDIIPIEFKSSEVVIK